MNQPLKHHYLPVFYLKKWARADGRVCRYYRPPERPDGKTVTSWKSPKYTGYEEQLYTLHGAPDPQMVEKDFFSPADNDAAPILDYLIAHGPAGLDNDARGHWTRFIMSLQLRSPQSLAEVQTVVDGIVRENILRGDAEYQLTRQPDDPETVYDLALQQAPEQLANAHKVFLPGLIDHEIVGQRIINMRWAVMDLSAGKHTLLTADRPYITSHGLGATACLLAVPLSPNHLFVAGNDINQLRMLAAQKAGDTVRNANNLVARLAVQSVYGSTDSHLAFIEKRLRHASQRPVPGVITY